MNPVKKFSMNYFTENIIFELKNPKWSIGPGVNFCTG